MPYRKSPPYAVNSLIPQIFRGKTQKSIEKRISRGKTQAWHHWPNHFESTKKVTQLIEQVNVM